MRSQLFELNEKRLGMFRRIAVVGDLHGDYKTLCSILTVVDPTKDAVIFLGDYADRGLFGVETLQLISSLAKKNPSNVIALKGNHEDYTEQGVPNFGPCSLLNEARRKGGDWKTYFEKELKPFVDNLYLAAIVPNEILFVHGGISNNINSLDDLRYPTEIIERDILWADPFEGKGERFNRKRGISTEFGIDVTMDVCKRLGVETIVRSHEPKRALNGPHYSHDGKVITISSTTEYGGVPHVLCINSLNRKQSQCFYP